jgi:anti-sigma B factor antagonist
MSATQPEAVTNTLKLETFTDNEGTVVQCVGRLTAEHSQALKNYVKQLLPQAKRIVLDLDGVTRMDSVGLGALVGLYVSAKKEKCDLLLANYNKSIKDLLGITNLLSVFETCAQTGTRFP